MLRIRFILALILIVVAANGFAQTGTIRGQVIESSTGETLIGVTVLLKGTTTGSVTDIDGKFEIKAPEGVHELQVSFVSFETLTITGVQVKSGEVTVLETIQLKESVEELGEVIVTAESIRDSESSLLTIKRKSANLVDGISAANFKKIGDSDASDAAKRVTGVSVEGGKYIYVRGLGDRYTKTTLNNVDIPGLDPDRNSLQMDIFPTNLIDNMMVLKSSVAEMPADFTGGVVNIETKDFPDEKIFNVSASIGFNPGMHFNDDYISYAGGKKDFLGFDDGTRALPEEARKEEIPSPLSKQSDEEINSFLKKFNPTLGATKQRSFVDYSLGLSTANQISLGGDKKLGYIFSLTYKNTTRFYDDVVYGEYQRTIRPDEYELRYATLQTGAIGENNVLLGGLGGLAFKTGSSKLMLTLMHLQNGESRAGNFAINNDGEAVGQSGYFAESDNLEYNQRGLTNLMLHGDHFLKNDAWKIDWRLSPTRSTMTDPDIRRTAFTLSNLDTSFVAGAGGNPSRIWRYLTEDNLVGKIDITREYRLFNEPAKLRFGVSHVYKQRHYEILTYDLQFFGNQPDVHGDPNAVLTPENLYPEGKLYYASGNNTPNPNSYNSSSDNTGVYVSNEFSPLKRLKIIAGLRAEKFVQRHTGRDVEFANFGTGNNLDNEKVLDAIDFFPSLNTIYALDDVQNLRFSYSRTIARPSFKELSFAQVVDPITNRIFNGGLFQYGDWDGKLSETHIDNYDVRWERFMKNGQMFSVSVFYKSFTDPIELVRIPEQQTSTEYQPRNVGDGRVLGAEIEGRKSLDFIATPLQNFSLTGNFTMVRSSIEMTNAEFNSRRNYEKQGETIKNTRQMAGQAPYIVNGGLSYDNSKLGIDGGLFYNVKGSTLILVGGGLFPDVYAQPFHSLNFNINKSFGKEQKSSVTFNVSNILNDVREESYKGFKAADQYFTKYSPKTSFSVGLKYGF